MDFSFLFRCHPRAGFELGREKKSERGPQGLEFLLPHHHYKRQNFRHERVSAYLN